MGKTTCPGRHWASHRGIALLMVLWILTILMVLALSLSFMVRTEKNATLSFKNGIKGKFLAEAGIARGIMEIFYRDQYKNLSVEFEETKVWKTDGTPYNGSLGNGSYTVRITDESGKVDINSASDVVLKNLLVNTGIPTEEADVIVDSVMDWRDPDDLHRLNGAEDDYYLSLPNPYKAKNNNFDLLEELILVRGVTYEVLYGTNERQGILDFLTVHSHTQGINVNAAPKEVLMAIPGMTSEIADSILTFRESKEILSVQEIQGLLGADVSFMLPYMTTQTSNAFSIAAVGYKGDEAGYGVKAVVSTMNIDELKYLYYKSPAVVTR
jgi:general secretion pathway protein K